MLALIKLTCLRIASKSPIPRHLWKPISGSCIYHTLCCSSLEKKQREDHSDIFNCWMVLGAKHELLLRKQGSSNKFFRDIKGRIWFRYWNNNRHSWYNSVRNDPKCSCNKVDPDFIYGYMMISDPMVINYLVTRRLFNLYDLCGEEAEKVTSI